MYFRGLLGVMWRTERTFAVCWLLCDRKNLLSRYADCYVTEKTYFRGMLNVMWPKKRTFAVRCLLCDRKTYFCGRLIVMWQKNILSRYADCYVAEKTYFRGTLIVMCPTEHTFAVCYTHRQTESAFSDSICAASSWITAQPSVTQPNCLILPKQYKTDHAQRSNWDVVYSG